MDITEYREIILQILRTSQAAILTTVDKKGYPQTRAMLNLRYIKQWPKLVPFFQKQGNDFIQYFTTNTSSTKVTDIKQNPAVSVYYCIPDEWRGVMFGGKMEIVEDVKTKKLLWQEDWDRYYPSGFADPDHTVLRLLPTIARGWNQSTTFRFGIGVDDETRE